MDSDSSDEPYWYDNRQRRVQIDDEEVITFLRLLSSELARGREFAVVAAGDEAVRRANRDFRGESGSTDVLSFPDGEDGRLGDILISAARAERQAADYGHSVETEMKTLALHGLLHLLGYDHEADDGQMRRAEKRWRKRFGLEAGLIERAKQ